MMRRFKLFTPGLAHGLLAALLALTASVCTAGVSVSAPAPDFTLRTQGGPNLRLQEQRGKVVLVNFWATWCGPCRQEMPHLNKLQDKYRSAGLLILGVNVDDDTRNAAEVSTKLGLKFPVLFDTDKAVSKLYDMSTMPSTVVIDREGRVRFVHRGYRSGYETTYDQQIRELLKE
jgi:peroxiredoxin